MTLLDAGTVEPRAWTRERSMPPPPAPDRRPPLDPDSQSWLETLRADGPIRHDAIARLHDLLLRAARFEVARRRASLARWAGPELDDLAMQSADDALVAVLAKLDTFRGQSRFTTWAYKFALLEASVKLRRRPWQGRELPLEPEHWPDAGEASSPQAGIEQAELLEAVRVAIEDELTPHQRDVLVAVALNGVPIDVLAERMGTTRGALYKTIHDARRKLRRRLEADGHLLEPSAAGGATP
jgi:RNA polymerase sigma-70 factor, ECF subfamily